MVTKTQTLISKSGRNSGNREKKTHSRVACRDVETILMRSEKGHQAHMEGYFLGHWKNPFHTGKLRQNAVLPSQMFQLCINTGKKYSFFGFHHTFPLVWVTENEYKE